MAINTPVQGLGADCLKYAMSLLVKELADKPYIRPILTVHDSLVFLVRDDRIEEARELIRRCMETPPDLPGFTPLVAEVSVGKMIRRCMETPPDLPGFTPLVAEVSVGKKYGELE